MTFRQRLQDNFFLPQTLHIIYIGVPKSTLKSSVEIMFLANCLVIILIINKLGEYEINLHTFVIYSKHYPCEMVVFRNMQSFGLETKQKSLPTCLLMIVQNVSNS